MKILHLFLKQIEAKNANISCFMFPFAHLLYCFQVQQNSLVSIAFKGHHCMPNVELSLFVSCKSRERALPERAQIAN